MTLLRVPLAVLAGTVLGSSALPAAPPAGPVAPTATALVVQAAACPATPAADAARTAPTLPSAARRLAAAGAELTVVCNASEATAAVIRAASTHRAVTGAGPDVRAALALAAADHPGVRFTALP